MQRLTVKKKMVGDFCGWRTIRRNEKIPVLQMLLGFPGCTFYWTSSRLNLLSFATKNCTTTSFRDSFKLGMEGAASPWTQDGWCWWPDQVTFPQTKLGQVSFSQTKTVFFNIVTSQNLGHGEQFNGGLGSNWPHSWRQPLLCQGDYYEKTMLI